MSKQRIDGMNFGHLRSISNLEKCWKKFLTEKCQAFISFFLNSRFRILKILDFDFSPLFSNTY